VQAGPDVFPKLLAAQEIKESKQFREIRTIPVKSRSFSPSKRQLHIGRESDRAIAKVTRPMVGLAESRSLQATATPRLAAAGAGLAAAGLLIMTTSVVLQGRSTMTVVPR
jgi:hypothetical protein